MTLRILIVEDEDWAKDSLMEMLGEQPGFLFEAIHLKTVRQAVDWLSKHRVDLIFMDIQLGDGMSFSIFEEVAVTVPVIFTTAFEQYALEAFRNQGYAYLLKPYDETDLQSALARVSALLPVTEQHREGYRSRFLVRYGVRLKSLPTTDIAYFMAEDKLLYVLMKDGGRYILEDTISNLSDQLDPSIFFRVSRKFIVSAGAIEDMLKLSRNRIRLQLMPTLPAEVEAIVSEDRSPDFQRWLDQ